jgi:hypothetical protein
LNVPSEHAKVLLEMIDQFLARTLEFDSFNDAFVTYLVEVADGSLSEPEEQFFEKVHDKLDFTGVSPGRESRSYGWIDVDEFRWWLKARRQEAGGPGGKAPG